MESIIRLAAVQQRTGLSKSTLYRLIAESDFPTAIHLSRRCRGWSSSEIDKWLERRCASRNTSNAR